MWELIMRKSVIAVLIISLVFGFNSPSSSANAPERADYIVKFVDRVNLNEEISSLEKSNIKSSRTFRNVFKGGVFSMTEAQANALSNNPRVEIVERDETVSITATQSSNLPWGLDRIDSKVNQKLDNTYTYVGDGNGVTAYVIDTGIRVTHSQFEGRASFGVNTTGDGRNEDCNGHGTHVAGTIGGKDYGVAKKVTLVAVKVLNCAGSGSWSGVIAGMDWVVAFNDESKAKAVVNMSLGGGLSSSVNAAAERLVADNIVVAVAAGNDGRDAKNFSPASARNVITVGATNSSDVKASWSNFGSTVELFAPGVDVLSSISSGDNASALYSGTSMASPHVAGAAARLLSSASCTSPCTAASARTQLLSQTTNGVVVSAGRGSPNALLYMDPSQ
jgi:subtilisin family serine protease